MTTPATRTAAAVAVAVSLGVTLAGCSGGSSGGGPSGSARPTSTASIGTKGGATSAPSLPKDTASPRVAVSAAPVVPVGQVSPIAPQVLVRVRKVANLTVGAKSPGDIAGPAVAVTLAVSNSSGSSFPVGGLVVTASYHGGLPGDQTDAGPSDPMTGKLRPGRAAEGVYVFRVPRRYASSLQVEVTSDHSPTIVRFAR